MCASLSYQRLSGQGRDELRTQTCLFYGVNKHCQLAVGYPELIGSAPSIAAEHGGKVSGLVLEDTSFRIQTRTLSKIQMLSPSWKMTISDHAVRVSIKEL